MTPGSELQKDLRLYLLGQLDDRTAEALEEQFLLQDEIFEELLATEDELIEDYLAEALTAEDRRALENHFLSTPDRLDQLRFGRTFRRYLFRQGPVISGEVSSPVDLAPADAQPSIPPKTKSLTWWTSPRAFFASPWRAVAFAAVVLAVGFGAWSLFIRQSAVDEGLLALNSAYREQRPLESRISNFNYAPYVVTRGPVDERIDRNKLSRAELTLLNELETKPSPAVHHALGKVYLAKKDFEKAIDEFNESLKGDPNNAQTYSDLGAAWLEKGKADRDGKEPGKGLEELGRSLENLNKSLNLDPNLLPALFNRALLYQYLGAPSEAKSDWKGYLTKDANSAWAEEARRNLRRLEETDRQTRWSSGTAVDQFLAARRRQDDDTAWRLVAQYYTADGNQITNSLVRSFCDARTSAEVAESFEHLTYLARLELARTGDRFTMDLASHYQNAAEPKRQILGDAHRQMREAYSLFTQSQFREAVELYNKIRKEYEAAKDFPELAFLQYRLAHCYLFLPDLPQANITLNQLSRLCESRGYYWLLGQSFYGRAHSSLNNCQYSEAISFSEKALSNFRQVGDLNGILKSMTQLADVNQVFDQIDTSLRYLSGGLTLAANSPIEPMQKWGLTNELAFSMSSRNLLQAALAFRREALRIALDIGRPLIISRSYGYLGSEYAALRMYPEAVDAASHAVETGDSMSTRPGGLEIIANASQQLGDIYRAAGDCTKAIASYDRSIDSYLKLNTDYYSYAAHKGKLLCFIANSNDQAAREELPKVLSLSEAYRSKITVESQRLSFFATHQAIYDLAIQYEFSHGDPVKALDYSEWSRARALLDQIRGGARFSQQRDGPNLNLPTVTKTMTLTDIQEAMPTDSQILQYAVLDNHLIIWLITKSAFHHQVVQIAAAELTKKIQAYLKTVNHQPGTDMQLSLEGARELYDLLLAPVEPFLDKLKYLCIVADGILNFLPFDALVSSKTGRYLIEDYDIGSAPSSSTFVYLTRLAQRKALNLNQSDEVLLSIGDPWFDQRTFGLMADLPSAASEVEGISAFYRRNRRLWHEGATETAVRADITSCDTVHFAAHYVPDDNSEILSGFPLSPERRDSSSDDSANGFLQSYEIYHLNLTRPRLVVLAGCQTGIEQHYAGEGAISAARPFMVAGVPTIVASLWRVDSEASAELMIGFHRHRILASQPTAHALRLAQLDMIHGTDHRYQQPYFWAGFVTIGGHSSY